MIASKYLRVAVLEGGCSGNEYRLGFENDEHDGDSKFDCNGVTLIVDEQSLSLVNGVEIDYQNGLQGSFFVFNNPQATGGCGCGKSFSA